MSRFEGGWVGEEEERQRQNTSLLECSTCMVSECLNSLGLHVAYIPPCTLCHNFMLHNGACTSISAYTRGVILH